MYAIKYYIAMKMSELQLHAAFLLHARTQMDLTSVML